MEGTTRPFEIHLFGRQMAISPFSVAPEDSRREKETSCVDKYTCREIDGRICECQGTKRREKRTLIGMLPVHEVFRWTESYPIRSINA